MNWSEGTVVACVLLAGNLLAAEPAAPGELTVDCAQAAGEIRALHGGNCGPIQFGELVDLSAYFREARFPILRLHDCHWPNPDVVDIHTIFPSFAADPERPESYDFRRTDDYLKATLATGAQVVYRLGESIEHSKRKYHVHPPQDVNKWAAICRGIIRHYNEGWANGFRHNIRYWEIWNEPENRPAMWTGNDEDYFRLYEVTAKAIKAQWPELKVGGPSLGHTGRIAKGQFEPGEFLTKFLERCRDRALPLDFFSWHLYTNDPSECMVRARGIRAALDRCGFEKTESHFNEWNYLPGNDWKALSVQGQGELRERFVEQLRGAPGAAFAACVLTNLQDAPVTVSNFYMNDTNGFGMFTEHGVPCKNYYAMRAFTRLLETPLRVQAAGGRPDQITICAGTNRDKSAVGVLISNFRGAGPVRLTVRNLPWQGATRYELAVVNAAHNLEAVCSGTLGAGPVELTEELKAPAVGVVTLKPER
jgi:hypothetical protein